MTIRDFPPGIQSLNQQLDRIRTERAMTNDVDLARYLHISGKTLSFMRHGRLNRVALVVVAILTGDHSLIVRAPVE